MLKRLYSRMMELSAHRHAVWALAAVSFIESSVFPIPPDVILIPMVLAARDKAWKFAAVCTAASVIGGIAGYGIGYFLFENIGRPIVDFYGYGAKFAAFQETYNQWGAWIVAGAGLTPFPYKVITIASGVTALNPLTFIIASVVSRGLRFYIVAALLWKFGEPIRAFIEKNLGKLTAAFFVLLLGGFLLIRYLA